MSPSLPAEGSLQMRVQLRDVDPTVWRRLLVPDGITMADLAEILLLAMGWGNLHLHLFEVGDVSYGPADEDADDDEIDERDVIVSDALGSHQGSRACSRQACDTYVIERTAMIGRERHS